MPFRLRHYSPEATFFSLIVAGILKLIPASKASNRNKRTYKPSDKPSEAERNVSTMQKLVSKYEGYSTEVIPINVFGRRQVKTCRLIPIGREVEIRMKKDDIKVFAYGEYIADILLLSDSNLPRLLNEHINFDAYLGGRDMSILSDTYDSCSIIVFYKMDGVPPTKVNIVNS